jgi:hypothetical protein
MACMLFRRDHSNFRLVIYGLISLWIFFGCLEFAESLDVLTEVLSDSQDLDEQALLQLTFGLKPDLLGDGRIGGNSATVDVPIALHAELPVITCRRQPLSFHSPPSRPLYQQLSVYRI